MYCENCGYELDKKATSCINCGKRVLSEGALSNRRRHIKHICPGCISKKGNSDVCPSCGWREGTLSESLLHLPMRTILENKYFIGRVLGQGGFGVTYLAMDMDLEIRLAIKEYLPQGLASRILGCSMITINSSGMKKQFDYGQDKFLDEARLLASFEEHPNIVTVRDYFQANGTAYMVMNYFEGHTFKDYLDLEGGKVSFKKALDIMIPVMDALRSVHGVGMMHRDISPDNIIVTNKGRVILIDFGAARHDMRERSRNLSVILKPGYAPEEQYRSRGKQGPWTDVYGVGATIYRAITGRMPPEALDRVRDDVLVPPSRLGIDIEDHYERILLKSMAVLAENRYQRIRDMQQDYLNYNNISVTGKDSSITDTTEDHPSETGVPAYNNNNNNAFSAPEATVTAGSLNIGDRIVDYSWEWEYKTGNNYTGNGLIKPVTWIVTSINHYSGMEDHITLLSEELAGLFVFDNSTDRGSQFGSNHWGESGFPNAEKGLRYFLNSFFYGAFSDKFKNAILPTLLINSTFDSGSLYTTEDSVFILTGLEMGWGAQFVSSAGYMLPFFALRMESDTEIRRQAVLNNRYVQHWTRSPAPHNSFGVETVGKGGEINEYYANGNDCGFRPVVNIKGDLRVSLIQDADNLYGIV